MKYEIILLNLLKFLQFNNLLNLLLCNHDLYIKIIINKYVS